MKAVSFVKIEVVQMLKRKSLRSEKMELLKPKIAAKNNTFSNTERSDIFVTSSKQNLAEFAEMQARSGKKKFSNVDIMLKS